MKIRLQPADHGGCGSYRLRWPARALLEQGCDIEVAETWPKGTFVRHGTGKGARHTLRSIDCDADVIVFQRPMDRVNVDAVPVLQAQGTAVVVEVDDDFHALPSGHPARKGTSARENTDVNRRWLRRMCELADLVVVSTPALAARYGAHGRCVVIPNYVPAWYLSVDLERTQGPWRVGWTGSTQTHVDDLRVTGGGVARAVVETGAVFHCVGTGVGVQDQLELEDEPSATGWVEIDRYPIEYATLDVAIVPLQPHPFNEAKSALKGLEAAALGVPFVASPTGPYRQLHDHGVGRLASTPGQWFETLVELLADHRWRGEQAEAGRAWAATQTVELNCWRWLEAWEQASCLRVRGHAA